MKNVYEMVTDRVISALESGNIPWEKPWGGCRSGAYNFITRKSYSLMNQMLLKHRGAYGTFKQWTEKGGKIRKGEKSEIVVFWKFQIVEEENEDGEKEEKKIPILKYYNVFHISQVEGVTVKEEELPEVKPIESAEKIKREYVEREHIRILEYTTNEAFYSPAGDFIQVPERGQYRDANEFYSTLYHEMVHSTGHKSRLNRLERDAHFGNEIYSKEELVAELGAAFLMNLLGIEKKKTFRNSTAYIQNWIQVLKNDPRFVVSAAGKAEKAVHYIMGEDLQE
jgi:antirestriction protein ArdC